MDDSSLIIRKTNRKQTWEGMDECPVSSADKVTTPAGL